MTVPVVDISFVLNGEPALATIEPRELLIDVLREKFGLTGAKRSCDIGVCGACTVLVDGLPASSCSMLAADAEGRAVTTIEGLGTPQALDPVQQAFIDHDAFQCGYCTPGQIMSATACIASGRAGSEAEIREYMSGNLCRCAAYPNIVAAIQAAKTQVRS